jgi:signal transduction histidine kinase
MRPRLAGSTRPAHRPPGQAGRRKVQGCAPGHVLSSGLRRLSPLSPVGAQVYGERVPGSRWSWAALARPVTASDDLPLPDVTDSHVGREWTIDSAAVVLALALGALFLSPELHDTPDPLAAGQIAVDVTAGLLACLSLWWRRRWPIAVALVCLVLGTISASATPAGLLALSSLAVHRRTRATVLVTLLWIPSVVAFAVYSPTTDPATVLLFVMPLALAASGWGMFIRARRQLLLSLRERMLRAEADRELHEEYARVAERTRIAREMHDVLAHRISLIALHAGGLEVRPDLPPEQIRSTAALLGATARQALEELRGVIGVLRENGFGDAVPAVPQPTLRDIGHLVEETRIAGTDIDYDLDVADIEGVPATLGRDAYRIVPEGLTNVAKHAGDATARVRVVGSPGEGLHVSVRNREGASASTVPTLPGSGTGLLGLRERVALSRGTIMLGPDGSGDFVVEAELAWHV